MNAQTKSAAATAAMEAARQSTGQFGTQGHADPGIVAAPTDPRLRDWGEWQDRGDLDGVDDISSGCSLTGTQVTYDPEGYAAVSIDVRSGGDEYMWHVERFLGVSLSDSEVREAVQDWLNDGASTLIDEKLQERYGCSSECANENDPCPTFVWYSDQPGVLTDEQICNAAHDVSVRYRNEKDPGTFGSEYPWHDWVKAAVDEYGSPMPEWARA